jgi:agmatine deiminase
MNKILFYAMAFSIATCAACSDKTPDNQTVIDSTILYTMPEESEQHEATWLQWPHHYQYGVTFRDRLDATWVTMTKTLAQSEKVYLIAYDETEKTRITALLNAANVSLTNI